MSSLDVYVDGACEPNPNPNGEMGIGVIIRSERQTLREISEKVVEKTATNNIAEYMAVIRALQELKTLGGNYDIVVIKSDSQLIVNQLMGGYTVRDHKMRQYYGRAKSLQGEARKALGAQKLFYKWIDRYHNYYANELAEKAILGEKGWRIKKNREQILSLISRGVEVIPLSIFRREGWEDLTISEALVLELVEKRGMSIKKVAEELKRAYTTIHTTYNRAKAKVKRSQSIDVLDN
jgi:ribonuclease HI